MHEPSAYLHGEWIPASELRISCDDLGFMMGATVVERWRTFCGSVFQLEAHLGRFRKSLEIVGLDAASICEKTRSLVPESAARECAELEPGDDVGVVAFATPGDGGGKPTLCVYSSPLPFHRWAHQFQQGVRTTISAIRQVPVNCWPAELKCRSRMHYYLAEQAARQHAPEARAILVDQEGYVSESTTANVVAYRLGEGLVSPPIDRILPGVTLAVTEKLSHQLGIPFSFRPIGVDELKASQEAMLVSTSICMLPIVECDGQKIGSGQPGPVYHRLLAAWNDLTGLDVAAQAMTFANARGGPK